jgi:hypothetical protein
MAVTTDSHQLKLTVNGKEVGNTLKELEGGATKLRKQIRDLEIGSKEWVKATEDFKKINSRIKEVKNEVNGVGKEMGTFKKALLGAFTGAALWDGIKALSTGLFKIGKDAVAAFNEGQVEAGKFKYNLTTLGGESEKTFNRLLELSGELQYKTFGFSEEQIQEQMGALKTFGLTGAEIEKLIPKILDYATVNGKDLAGATDDVKNALMGKDKALKAVGISLDKNQLTVEGVSTAFDKFHGAAENALNIGTNRLEQVTDTLGDLEEELGEKLIPFVQQGAEAMVDLLQNIEPVEEVVTTVVDALGDLWAALWDIIGAIIPMNQETTKGSIIMKGLALALNIASVPLKALATFLRIGAEGFKLLINEGKKAANFFGADFKIDPTITASKTFDNMGKIYLEGAEKIKQSFIDIFTDQEKEVEQAAGAVEETAKKSFLAQEKLDDEAAKKRKEALKKRNEDLKKLEEQRLKDEADANKNMALLAIQLIRDEEKKRIAELENRAKNEIAVLVGSEEQKAAQEELIQEKLQREITQIREDAAKKRAEKELQLSNRAALATADLEIIHARGNTDALVEASLAKLEIQKEIELQNTELIEEERLLIHAQYALKAQELEDRLREERKAKDLAVAQSSFELLTGGLQAITDFAKIKSDEQINEAERVKTARIKKLDQELAQGKISQDGYNYLKQQAEEEATKKANRLKYEQAKKEKQMRVTEAILAGLLAVVKAAPNPFLMAFAALTSGLTVAKMVATPLPTYKKGGWLGRKLGFGGLVKGPSHESGGIDLNNSQTGEKIAEIEGNEFIINAGVSRNPYLLAEAYALNEKAKHFADGGPINPLSTSVVGQTVAAEGGTPAAGTSGGSDIRELQLMRRELQAIRGTVEDWPRQLKVINVVQETEEGIKTVNELKEEASF